MTAPWRPAAAATPSWHAQLKIQLEKSVSKTVIKQLSHFGPVRVLRPYYPGNNGSVQIYLLHPPGALVGGDRVEFCIQAGEATHSLFTTPSAGKFNRALTELVQTQVNRITAQSDARLEWLPQENIYFDAAQAEAISQIMLDETTYFAGWDISCFGRPAANERFQAGKIRTQFQIFQIDVPIINESTRFELPRMASAFQFSLQERTVSGLFCINNINGSLPEEVVQILDEQQTVIAATRLNDWLFIRYLGFSAEQAKQLYIRIWSLLKPIYWQQEFIPPRIWAH